jgi:hypothetical protein
MTQVHHHELSGVIEFTGGILGQTNNQFGSARDRMTAIPLLSFFTRPVTVLVELRDDPCSMFAIAEPAWPIRAPSWSCVKPRIFLSSLSRIFMRTE